MDGSAVAPASGARTVLGRHLAAVKLDWYLVAALMIPFVLLASNREWLSGLYRKHGDE